MRCRFRGLCGCSHRVRAPSSGCSSASGRARFHVPHPSASVASIALDRAPADDASHPDSRAPTTSRSTRHSDRPPRPPIRRLHAEADRRRESGSAARSLTAKCAMCRSRTAQRDAFGGVLIHADAEKRHLIAETPAFACVEIARVAPPLDFVVGMTDVIGGQRNRPIRRDDRPLICLWCGAASRHGDRARRRTRRSARRRARWPTRAAWLEFYASPVCSVRNVRAARRAGITPASAVTTISTSVSCSRNNNGA